MSDNKRAITLEPHSVGDLLVEVTRAFLHGGNPSVLVKRMREGVVKFITEKQPTMDPAERAILDTLVADLEALYVDTQKTEEHHYSM